MELIINTLAIIGGLIYYISPTYCIVKSGNRLIT